MKQRIVGIVVSFCMVSSMICGLFLVLAESVIVERFLVANADISTEQDILDARREVRAFLSTGRELSTRMFTDREIVHMQDVQGVFQTIRIIVGISCILLLFSIAFGSLSLYQLRVLFARASSWIMACVTVFAGSVAVAFDAVFTSLHHVLFTNDFWILDPSEHILIRAYPVIFFQSFAVLYMCVLIVSAGALYVICRRQSR